MKSPFIVILFLLFFFCSTHSFGNMYSWKDENGVRHFSNNRPPDHDEARDLEVSQELKYDAAKDTHRMEKARTQSSQGTTFSENKRTNNKKTKFSGDVVMFSTTRCGYCVRAKSFLDKHKVQYTNIDINKSKDGRKQFKKLNGRGVPLILVGDKQIRGFNKPALKKALGL